MTERSHELKVLPSYFHALFTGLKNFEVRRDDRGFQKGDILILRCWDAADNCWAKDIAPIRKRITYVLTGGQFGIEPGYVVMALTDEVTPNERIKR